MKYEMNMVKIWLRRYEISEINKIFKWKRKILKKSEKRYEIRNEYGKNRLRRYEMKVKLTKFLSGTEKF